MHPYSLSDAPTKVIDMYPRWIVHSWSSHTQMCYSLFGVLFFRETPLAAVIRAVDTGVQINHLLRWFKMQHMHRFWFFSIPLPPRTMKVAVKEEFTPFFDTETSADERSEGSRSQRRRSEQKELLEAPFERTGHLQQLHRMCWRAVQKSLNWLCWKQGNLSDVLIPVPRRVGTVWYCQHERKSNLAFSGGIFILWQDNGEVSTHFFHIVFGLGSLQYGMVVAVVPEHGLNWMHEATNSASTSAGCSVL